MNFGKSLSNFPSPFQIDGEPLSGLCIVGLRTLWAYCAMVVAPLTLCLFIKALYLGRAMRAMMRLRRYLTTVSYQPIDREMGHRLLMCCRAYGKWNYLFFVSRLDFYSAEV